MVERSRPTPSAAVFTAVIHGAAEGAIADESRRATGIWAENSDVRRRCRPQRAAKGLVLIWASQKTAFGDVQAGESWSPGSQKVSDPHY